MSAERLTSAIASVLSMMLRIFRAMLTTAEGISRMASIRPEALVTGQASVAALCDDVGRAPPRMIMKRRSCDLAAHDSHGQQQYEYPAVEMQTSHFGFYGGKRCHYNSGVHSKVWLPTAVVDSGVVRNTSSVSRACHHCACADGFHRRCMD